MFNSETYQVTFIDILWRLWLHDVKFSSLVSMFLNFFLLFAGDDFSTPEVAAWHATHLQHSIAIRSNLELKTRPIQLLVSLPLDIALPAFSYNGKIYYIEVLCTVDTVHSTQMLVRIS